MHASVGLDDAGLGAWDGDFCAAVIGLTVAAAHAEWPSLPYFMWAHVTQLPATAACLGSHEPGGRGVG